MFDFSRKDDENPTDNPEDSKVNSGRRNFLAHSSVFTASLVGTALLGACDGGNGEAMAQNDNDRNRDDAISDAAVLQFALNLEYLEAEYYLRATTGMGLPRELITSIGISSGPGSQPGDVIVPPNAGPVALSGTVNKYANEIAADERNHVAFLRSALEAAGVPVPARPKINLDRSFDTAATAAGVSGGTLNPFAGQLFFTLGAYIFEDVGVTAYKGAAPFLYNETYLSAAAGILAAEAYHAGLIRTVLYEQGQSVRGITDQISDARDSLAAPDTDKDQGTAAKGTEFDKVTLRGQTYAASNIAPLDKNGIAFGRTPGQVLNIAYLNPNTVDAGGFFPNGVNVPANAALEKSA